MHTGKFLQALGNIYESYRKGFLASNPGHNENDAERAFLEICMGTCWWDDDREAMMAIRALIDSIV